MNYRNVTHTQTLIQQRRDRSPDTVQRMLFLMKDPAVTELSRIEVKTPSDLSSSYSSLFRRKNFNPTQDLRSSQRPVSKPSKSQKLNTSNTKINVVKCNRDQFQRINRSFTEKSPQRQQNSPSRLSIMISQAKQGLNLLEDKINNISVNQQRDSALKERSLNDMKVKTVESKIIMQNNSSAKDSSIRYGRSSITEFSPPREFDNTIDRLMQRLQELEMNDRSRDQKVQNLQTQMEKVQIQLDAQHTKRRQKQVMRKIVEMAHNVTPQQTLRTEPNLYTFTNASPQKHQDYREFIIHTQSQQILMKNSKA